MIGRRPVAERVAAQSRGDQVGAGDRVEDEVDGWVGGHRASGVAVAKEGVVHQVVEDRPVLLGLGAVVGQEPLRRAGAVFPHAGRREADADGQDALLFAVAGHLVGLAVEHGLKPMFDPAEEAIGVDHDPPFLGGQAADDLQPRQGDQGVGVADLGELAAVEQLEELDHELDVANPPPAGLHLDLGGPGRERALLDPPLHRLDLGDLGRSQIPAVDERGDRGEEVGPQRQIPGDRPALDERLALPRPSRILIISQSRCQRSRQRPLVPFRAEPHVDPIGHPQRRVVGQGADDLATEPGEVLGVRQRPGAGGHPFVIINENQVDVGAIVQLLAAELAQGQDHEPGGLAVAVERRPVLFVEQEPGEPIGPLDAGVGQVRQVERDQLQRQVADDVVVADPQQLAEPEPAEGELAVLGGPAFGQEAPKLGDHVGEIAPG